MSKNRVMIGNFDKDLKKVNYQLSIVNCQLKNKSFFTKVSHTLYYMGCCMS